MKLPNILKARKGANFVSLIAVTAITLGIVAVVLSSVYTGLVSSTAFDQTKTIGNNSNTTFGTVFTTFWSAMTLGAIVLTVIAAAAILRVVGGGFGGGD